MQSCYFRGARDQPLRQTNLLERDHDLILGAVGEGSGGADVQVVRVIPRRVETQHVAAGRKQQARTVHP